MERLELTLVSNRFLPLHTIAAIFNANGSVTISVRRLRRYIRLVGIRNQSAIRKQFIREANLLKRSAWAMRDVHWSMAMWARVVFTDETSFEVRPIKRNTRMWRREGERCKKDCMVPTYKSGYELVNVWGGFCCYGKLPLKRIVGSFKNHQYKETCETILWQWTTEVYGS